MKNIVLTHATVVTMNERREILRDGAVVVEGNKIVDANKTSDIKKDRKSVV